MDLSIDDAGFQRAMSKIITAADVAARRLVVAGGHVVERNAKAHARSRPGPLVQTGSHRRSIGVHMVGKDGVSWISETGPTMAYSRRLELGFDGVDSAGRVYHQQAYPSLGPGLEASRADLAVLAHSIYGKALRV